MTQISKEYDRPFVLEPTKLTSLLEILHEWLAGDGYSLQPDHFEVFLADDSRDELSNINEVLALENSRKRKIKRLTVVGSSSPGDASQRQREVRVDFAAPKTISSNNIARIVSIDVQGEPGDWARRAISAIEEQVERTRQYHTLPIVLALGLTIGALLFFLSQIVEFQPPAQDALAKMWLLGPDLERIDEMMTQDRTISDQEFREVATMQLRNVLQYEKRKGSSSKDFWQRLVVIGLPTVVVVGCLIFLATKCYPKAVFLWSDEVARYADLIHRRRMLWGIVISLAVVGVLSKFLYEGVATWLRGA